MTHRSPTDATERLEVPFTERHNWKKIGLGQNMMSFLLEKLGLRLF